MAWLGLLRCAVAPRSSNALRRMRPAYCRKRACRACVWCASRVCVRKAHRHLHWLECRRSLCQSAVLCDAHIRRDAAELRHTRQAHARVRDAALIVVPLHGERFVRICPTPRCRAACTRATAAPASVRRLRLTRRSPRQQAAPPPCAPHGRLAFLCAGQSCSWCFFSSRRRSGTRRSA
jgi:hypothetical protein